MNDERINRIITQAVREVLGEEVARVVDFVCPECGEKMDDTSYPGLWAKPKVDGNNELLVCEADKLEGDTLLLNLIRTGEMVVDKVICTECTTEFGPEDFGVKSIVFNYEGREPGGAR